MKMECKLFTEGKCIFCDSVSRVKVSRGSKLLKFLQKLRINVKYFKPVRHHNIKLLSWTMCWPCRELMELISSQSELCLEENILHVNLQECLVQLKEVMQKAVRKYCGNQLFMGKFTEKPMELRIIRYMRMQLRFAGECMTLPMQARFPYEFFRDESDEAVNWRLTKYQMIRIHKEKQSSTQETDNGNSTHVSDNGNTNRQQKIPPAPTDEAGPSKRITRGDARRSIRNNLPAIANSALELTDQQGCGNIKSNVEPKPGPSHSQGSAWKKLDIGHNNAGKPGSQAMIPKSSSRTVGHTATRADGFMALRSSTRRNPPKHEEFPSSSSTGMNNVSYYESPLLMSVPFTQTMKPILYVDLERNRMIKVKAEKDRKSNVNLAKKILPGTPRSKVILRKAKRFMKSKRILNIRNKEPKKTSASLQTESSAKASLSPTRVFKSENLNRKSQAVASKKEIIEISPVANTVTTRVSSRIRITKCKYGDCETCDFCVKKEISKIK